MVFYLLSLQGQSVIAGALGGLEEAVGGCDALEGHAVSGIRLVPYTDDAAGLWDAWVGLGGEGIVLKDRASIYRPGVRSPAWLKLKPKVTLSVTLTGGSSERIAWGDWGEAMMLEFRYTHPRTGSETAARQAVRVPRGKDAPSGLGTPAQIICWGIMPSGLLRHPFLLL